MSIHEYAERPALHSNDETAPNGRQKLQSARKGVNAQACLAWRPGNKRAMGHVARPLTKKLGMARVLAEPSIESLRPPLLTKIRFLAYCKAKNVKNPRKS